jgi:hypothetical protein
MRARCGIGLTALALLGTASVSAQEAKGWFEEFCNGASFHFTMFAGRPDHQEIALWLESRIAFKLYPTGTDWIDVQLCDVGQTCDKSAKAKLQFLERRKNLLSGRYVVDVNGEHREGRFAVKQNQHKKPQHSCM